MGSQQRADQPFRGVWVGDDVSPDAVPSEGMSGRRTDGHHFRILNAGYAGAIRNVQEIFHRVLAGEDNCVVINGSGVGQASLQFIAHRFHAEGRNSYNIGSDGAKRLRQTLGL
jgi:hypothetical protein